MHEIHRDTCGLNESLTEDPHLFPLIHFHPLHSNLIFTF